MTDFCESNPLRISWTNLLRFSECPMSARLMREGKREKGIINQRPFLTGSVVDNTQQAWLGLEDPTKVSLASLGERKLLEYVEKHENSIRWKGSQTQDLKTIRQDMEEAFSVLEPWLTENVLPYPYQPEARGTATMLVADRNGTLRCVDLFYAVDIAVKLPTGFKLYDLKTTRNEKYVQGKTLGQLTFYQLAWMVKFKLTQEDFDGLAFVTPLTSNMITEVKPGAKEMQVMASRIMKYAQSAWSSISPTKEEVDSSCRFRCEVRNSCPLYKLPEIAGSGKIDFGKLVEAQKLLSDTTEFDKLGKLNEQ